MTQTEAAVRPGGASAGTGATVVRADIQGLRALAVSLVFVYHLWPNALSGGFIGVDVFFVISGFLITSHLLAHPPRSGRDLAGFWARRIRRLLPASLLVLLTTLIATRLVAPETVWADTARQVAAAAMYVVNWLLASGAVDYLAADDAPSAVQHFWSLSVEEQFYAVWPVLILALVLLASVRRLSPRLVVGLGLGLVVAASLAFSVHETATDPSRAYFVTPTRIWELGVGGLVALFLSRRALGRDSDSEALPVAQPLRNVLAWAGLAAIVWTGFTYSGATPFPGWQALVPVMGTALVIAAHPGLHPASPDVVMRPRPVQWLGDVSYSVYLWHWPMIVLLPFASGGRLGVLDKAAICVLTLVLAGLTKKYVEDVFRTRRWNRRIRQTYLLGVVGMAVVVGLSLLQVAEVDRRQDQARADLARALAGDDGCLGAAALANPDRCADRSPSEVVPAPAQAKVDKSQAYADVPGGKSDCWSFTPGFPTETCTFGDPDGTVDVALVGNSHAGHWLPALQELAEAHGWRITTYLASQCAMAAIPQNFETDDHTEACLDWVDRTSEEIVQDRPDLVVMSNRVSVGAADTPREQRDERYAEGYREVLERWSRAGLRVAVLRDTPAPGDANVDSVPDCVAENPDSLEECSGERSAWVPDDPTVPAVKAVGDPGVRLVDLNDLICAPDRCAAVVGGVVVYFDGSHLTATYARTLAPHLGRVLEPLLRE